MTTTSSPRLIANLHEATRPTEIWSDVRTILNPSLLGDWECEMEDLPAEMRLTEGWTYPQYIWATLTSNEVDTTSGPDALRYMAEVMNEYARLIDLGVTNFEVRP